MVVAHYPYYRFARYGIWRRRFISGLYRDAPCFAGQAVGQDLISLSVVLPLLDLLNGEQAKRMISPIIV